MPLDTGSEEVADAPGHRASWFSPERPVNGGTVFLRPSQILSDGVAESDLDS